MTIARPDNLSEYWANGASTTYVNDIPVDAPVDPQLASFELGFPPITMTPQASGGLPPFGQDMNGILKVLSEHTRFQNSGGRYRFDSALATILGGYDAGTVLQANDGLREYVSFVNNNLDDFNSDPSSIGVTWLPYNLRSIVADSVTPGYITLPTSAGTFKIQFGKGLTDSAGEDSITFPLAFTLSPLYIGLTDIAGGTAAINVNILSALNPGSLTTLDVLAKSDGGIAVATNYYWIAIGI